MIFFYNIIDSEIQKAVSICIAPSSDPDNKESGMVKLGKKLSENGRKDRVYYLNRSRKIDKLAMGGCRSKEVHFESIDVDHTMSITGEFVLLMDDVTTTGNSLYACKDILINHGAENVEMFALGKSI